MKIGDRIPSDINGAEYEVVAKTGETSFEVKLVETAKPESSADVFSAVVDAMLSDYETSYNGNEMAAQRKQWSERFAAAQKREAEAPVYVLIQTVYANKEYMGLAGVFRRREDAEKAQGDCWDIVEEVKIQ